MGEYPRTKNMHVTAHQMNMRKKVYKKALLRARKAPATLLLWVSAPLILLSSLVLLHTIETSAPLTTARAAYLGGLVEYPAAAAMILTAGLALLHLAKRKN